MQNFDIWQEKETFCTIIKSQDREINTWLQQIGGPEFDDEIFSKFIYTTTCGPNIRTHTSYIEPLAAGLRHPLSFCPENEGCKFPQSFCPEDEAFIFSRAWLQPHQFENTNIRAAYVDIGASTFDDGKGGSSQQWFYDIYSNIGIEFDRWLLWEAEKLNATDVFETIPDDLIHSVQWFNIPATNNMSDGKNPLNIMKKLKRKDKDLFVILKLDMDNPIENEFLKQFGPNNVDEFYFEHHVKFPPMIKWGWNRNPFDEMTLADSARIFLDLRKKGIRAHSWP